MHGAISIASQAGPDPAISVASLNSDSIAYVDLNPLAERYLITVVGPRQIRAVGTWQAAPIRKGDIFIGDGQMAELVRSPRRIASGDYAYVTIRSGDPVPGGGKTLSLGDRKVTVVEAGPLTIEWLRGYVPNLQLDDYPMRVNVILPLDQDPQAERFIRVPDGTSLLLSIVPPIDSDPEFEIIPIPLRGVESQHLPRMGKGVARLLKLTVRRSTPMSLLVHWPGRVGRDKFLDIGVAPGLAAIQPSFQDTEIGCYAIRGDAKVYASSLEDELLDLVLELDVDHGMVSEEVRLRVPGNLRVTLDAEVLDGETAVWREQGETKPDDFPDRVRALFLGGARTVRVGFGPLGRVTIRCDHFFNKALENFTVQKKKAEQELADRDAAIAARRARQAEDAAAATRRVVELEAQRQVEARAIMEKTAQQMRERQERDRAASKERERILLEAKRVEAEKAAKAAAIEEAQRQREAAQRARERIETTIKTNLTRFEGDFPHRASMSFTARLMGLPIERTEEANAWRGFARKQMRDLQKARGRRSPALPEPDHPVASGSQVADPSPPPEASVEAEPPAKDGEGQTDAEQNVGEVSRTPDGTLDTTQVARRAEIRARRMEKSRNESAKAEADEIERKRRLRIASSERMLRAELGERYRIAVRRLKDRAMRLPEKADSEFVSNLFGVPAEHSQAFIEKYGEVIDAMLARARSVEPDEP